MCTLNDYNTRKDEFKRKIIAEGKSPELVLIHKFHLKMHQYLHEMSLSEYFRKQDQTMTKAHVHRHF